MAFSLQKTLSTVIKRSHVGLYSTQPLPRNIEELNDSHMGRSDMSKIFDACTRSHEVAVSQSSRIFSSRFLADQSSIQELTSSDQQLTADQQLAAADQYLDTRMMAYDLSYITIEMKTNVPEPFQAEDLLQDTVEGLPAGLSDAQVNLEARSNMDCRLDLSDMQNEHCNMI